jgi:hypothetical protein
MPPGRILRYVNFRASRGGHPPIDEATAAPDYCSIVTVLAGAGMRAPAGHPGDST